MNDNEGTKFTSVSSSQLKPDLSICRRVVGEHRYPLMFVTVSGAHLYGFASPDSDYDLRGVHILPAREVLALHSILETVESESIVDGFEIDLVTHDVAKFCLMMLKRNGYVLEQLLSPIVVKSTPDFDELRRLAPLCVTKHHAHHYLGFAETQWNLFLKESPPRIKPLLYVYRVLLTGIHLMRTGEIRANLCELDEIMRLSYLDDLIARKSSEREQTCLAHADLDFYASEYARLRQLLEHEQQRSALPSESTAKAALSELVVRMRLATIGSGNGA